jgi:hypothetical protein
LDGNEVEISNLYVTQKLLLLILPTLVKSVIPSQEPLLSKTVLESLNSHGSSVNWYSLALKEEDKYKTKLELAGEIITELLNKGFKIKLVLADVRDFP